MTARSVLFLRTQPGDRERLLALYRDRRILEEAAATVPGFIEGEVLESPADASLVCVTSLWASTADYDAWLASPVRRSQGEFIVPLLAGSPEGWVFDVSIAVEQAPTST